jgi:hypothetical protein
VTTAEPLAAVCAYLAAQTEVASLVGVTPTGLTGVLAGVPTIFRPELPRGFDQLMPTAAVVVRRAGGYQLFGKDYRPVADPRLDIAAYGTTGMQANLIATAVVVAMKRLTTSVWQNTLLYWANVAGGPISSFEASTMWPMYLSSFQVMHAEDTVT